MLPYQVCVCPFLAHRSLALIDMHEHLSLTQFKISSEIYIVVCWLESLSQVQCVAYFMIFFSYFSRGLMDRYLRINRLLERVPACVCMGDSWFACACVRVSYFPHWYKFTGAFIEWSV